MWLTAWRVCTPGRPKCTLAQHFARHKILPPVNIYISARLATTYAPTHSPAGFVGSPFHSSSVCSFSSLSSLNPGVSTAPTTPFPSGEVSAISIPDRMGMITWLAQHNAIDLAFFSAVAKRSKLLGPKEERPVDYSWIELTLRLSDPKAIRLRDVFRKASHRDALRSGRLLEFLDCFAGDIAFSYCRPSFTLNENKTDLFVTVAIDSIRLFDQEKCSLTNTNHERSPYISVNKDLILRGFVSHAGTSSLEITAELHQDGRPKKFLPRLSKECENPKIALQLREAEARQRARKERAGKALTLRGPDQEEAEFLHSTWIASTGAAKNAQKIQNTRLDSNILMQPETISVYGRAFGGYIMRSALELSFLTAQRFLRQTLPTITGMEDICFFDSVQLGDILHLASHVVWSDKDEVQIQVVASSSSFGSPLKKTNRLVFYYKQNPTDREKKDALDLQVYPQSYGEYMWFLEARRRAMKRNGHRETVNIS